MMKKDNYQKGLEKFKYEVAQEMGLSKKPKQVNKQNKNKTK